MTGIDEIAAQLPILASGGVGVAVLRRLFGGSVDAVGDALTRLTHKRLANIGRIVENADQKTRTGRPDATISERVALAVMNEGSYSDSDWVIEYLGGVLASARTPVSRDDRGMTWAALIARLSSYELRSHYVWYRTCRDLALNESVQVPIYIGSELQRLRFAMPYETYQQAMDFAPREDFDSCFAQALYGLAQEDLIEWEGAGKRDAVGLHLPGLPDGAEAMVLGPTPRGVHLYLWAAGLGTESASAFLDPDVSPFDNVDLDWPQDSFRLAGDAPHPWKMQSFVG